jgi:hypothetical protein
MKKLNRETCLTAFRRRKTLSMYLTEAALAAGVRYTGCASILLK